MSEGSITFIGTATTLIRCAGFTLLTDPNFLHRGELAYLGHGLASRRRTEPAMSVEELPRLDAVVLSHLHGDHFDRRAKAGLDKALPAVTTRHAARKLRPWGFTGTVGLRVRETHELAKDGARVRITAVPAQHAHGPFKVLLPPVMGSLLEFTPAPGQAAAAGAAVGAPYRVWLSGDTLLSDDLRQVPEIAGAPIDLAVLHLGGTKILRTLLVTMDGEQGVGALELVRPHDTVPVHYDDYTVFRSPLRDFLAAVERRRPPTRVHEVARGETWHFAA